LQVVFSADFQVIANDYQSHLTTYD